MKYLLCTDCFLLTSCSVFSLLLILLYCMSSQKRTTSALLSCCSCDILPTFQNKRTSIRNRRKSQIQKKSLKKQYSTCQINPSNQNDLTRPKIKTNYYYKQISKSSKTIAIPELSSHEQQQSSVDSNINKKITRKASTCRDILHGIQVTPRPHQTSRVQIDMLILQDSFEAKQQIHTTNIEKSIKRSYKSYYYDLLDRDRNQITNQQSYENKRLIDIDISLPKTEINLNKGFQIIKNVEIMISHPHTIADKLRQTQQLQQSEINAYDEVKSYMQKQQILPINSGEKFDFIENYGSNFFTKRQNDKKNGLILDKLKIIKSQFEPNQQVYKEASSYYSNKKINRPFQDMFSSEMNECTKKNNKISLKSKKSMKEIRIQYSGIIQHKSKSDLLITNSPTFKNYQEKKYQQFDQENIDFNKKRVESMFTPQQAVKKCMFKKCLAPLSSRARTMTSVSFGSKIQDHSDISQPISKENYHYFKK